MINKEFIKYLIFGILTTVVSVVSYTVLASFIGINYLISNLLSWIIAVLFAFITNRLYVFKSSGKLKNEIIKFYISRMASLLIETLIMFIMVEVLNFDDLLVKIGAQFMVIILNYVLSKIFVFK